MANENISIISRSVAVTGHRTVENLNEGKLEDVFRLLIKKGYDTYLVGMAVGFDTICFNILDKLRKEFDIKIIACIPCKEQSKFYKNKDKETYEEFLKKADKIVCFSDEYFNGCMQVRNRFMVDNSSVLIAHCKYFKGGAVYTLNYAKKKNKEIINV